MQLCDAFDLPIVILCDTPGIMVGPEVEADGARAPLQPAVRHRRQPHRARSVTIVLRKGYGLGAQAMAGGSIKAPLFCVAWPTGEFGGMGLEGAVRLGYRKELDADRRPRRARASCSRRWSTGMYEHGKALNVGVATSRSTTSSTRPTPAAGSPRCSTSAPPPPPRAGKKRPNIDTW